MTDLDKIFIELAHLVDNNHDFNISSGVSNYYDLNNNTINLDTDITDNDNPFYIRTIKNHSPFVLQYMGTKDSNPYIKTSGETIYHMVPVQYLDSSNILFELPLSKSMDNNVFYNYTRNNSYTDANFTLYRNESNQLVSTSYGLSSQLLNNLAIGEDDTLDIDGFWKVANAMKDGDNNDRIVRDIDMELVTGGLSFSNSSISSISAFQNITMEIADRGEDGEGLESSLPKIRAAVIYYNLPGDGNSFVTDSTPTSYENSFKHKGHMRIKKNDSKLYTFTYNFGILNKEIITSDNNNIYFTIKLIPEDGSASIHSIISSDQNNARTLTLCTRDIDENNNPEDLKNALLWLRHK